MDEQALIDREREQTKAKKSTAQAELTTQKELWTRAKVEWEETHQALVAASRFKGEAGNPPLLHDIQLNNSAIPSAPLSSAAQIVQNCWIAMTYRSSLRLAPAPASSLSHSSLTFVQPHSQLWPTRPSHTTTISVPLFPDWVCPIVRMSSVVFALICRPHWPAYCLDHVYRRNEWRGRKILTVLSPAHSLR